MAKNRRKKKNEEEILIDVVEAREAAQSFFEKHQMKIIGAVGIIVLLIGGFLAYKMLYQAPREKEAMTQMFKAEYQFQQDSFALALEGPGGGYSGLLDIIDTYNGTEAANMCKYYAGISYLNLNRFEDAIQYLSSYNEAGNVTSITKYGAMGDAESELGNFDAALRNYQKAVSGPSNDMLTPYYLHKLGLLSYRQGDNAGALRAFQSIEEDYPGSAEATDAAKYIGILQ